MSKANAKHYVYEIAEGDASLFVTPLWPGSTLTVGQLATPVDLVGDDVLASLEPSPAVRLAVAFSAMGGATPAKPASVSDEHYQSTLWARQRLRCAAHGRALVRLANGVDVRDEPALYARADRRTARRILDALTGNAASTPLAQC